MFDTTKTSNSGDYKRDAYKRSRIQSADSLTTSDSLIETANRESSKASKPKKVSSLKVDIMVANSKFEELATNDISESPYMSALNLPMIIEEDMESEKGNTFKFKPGMFLAKEDDESPFCKEVDDMEANFEDNCEHSELMNNLWAKIKTAH